MSTIRKDLIGVVMAGGQSLAAGDTVPQGITVDPSLLEDAPKSAPKEAEKPASKPQSKPAAKSTPKAPNKEEDDLSDILGGDEKPAPAKKN